MASNAFPNSSLDEDHSASSPFTFPTNSPNQLDNWIPPDSTDYGTSSPLHHLPWSDDQPGPIESSPNGLFFGGAESSHSGREGPYGRSFLSHNQSSLLPTPYPSARHRLLGSNTLSGSQGHTGQPSNFDNTGHPASSFTLPPIRSVLNSRNEDSFVEPRSDPGPYVPNYLPPSQSGSFNIVPTFNPISLQRKRRRSETDDSMSSGEGSSRPAKRRRGIASPGGVWIQQTLARQNRGSGSTGGSGRAGGRHTRNWQQTPVSRSSSQQSVSQHRGPNLTSHSTTSSSDSFLNPGTSAGDPAIIDSSPSLKMPKQSQGAQSVEVLDLTERPSADKGKEGEERAKARPTKLTSLQCLICMEPPTDLTTSPCGHAFCRQCLISWLDSAVKERRRATCPTCRTVVDGYAPGGGSTRAKTKSSVVTVQFMTRGAKTKEA